ncbi:AAA domain-containing protein [Actinoplanes philippinensis]|uniref:AAA domain-containing protein n=1 Tax=Actinoplanes philippinensis TaxID=35752 RepID=A0A1I2DGV6_9ACTN|nr:AAA domain-containing protein [Actinoplanes philippinensis]SFE79453.1 AAA domain-containing protein [Actinoplanes philippinensis]
MASTLVDLEHPPYRNEGFCAALELAVAAGRELGPAPGGRDAGLGERIQREAILRLRTGATVNPGLLPLLAEGRFAEDRGDPPGPDEVSRALAVPDVFCLSAPPGAARTATVLEIVRAATARGERVLYAAPRPPAVEAVLSRLPPGALVIRPGQPGAGPGSLAAAAADVQQRILARSQAAARSLEPWLGEPSPALGWLRRLTTALGEAAEARERADRAEAHRVAAEAAARERLGAAAREREQAVRAAQAAADQAADQVGQLTVAVRRAEASRLHRWRTAGLRRRLGEAVRSAAAARSRFFQTHALYEESARQLTQEVHRDSTVRAAADRAAFADVAARRALDAAERAAHHLTRLLPAALAGIASWSADPEGLAALAVRCQELEPVLRGRAGLLREWRQRAARPTRQLHAELLRYADVVATACLDAGRPEYGDLAFDLLILEDATRVPVPEALAPLVRARRAVLIGEPGRPPLRDPEVARAWVAARCPAGADPGELTALLTAGVFELVAARAPARNLAETGW